MRVGSDGLYTYPDISALCGKVDLDDRGGDTLLNPQLIIEVLSPSTEAYDRGEKFRRYEALALLTEYVLVSQNEPLIMRDTRGPNRTWNLTFFQGLAATLALTAVGVELPLTEIYDKVDFGSESTVAE